MRIVSGIHRGRVLDVPKGDQTRPTMDRTRQAVFNILRSALWALNDDDVPILYDAHILDVFAGSGAVGFEALSQGAAQITFFEKHPDAVRAIESNRTKMKVQDHTRLVKGDILRPPAHNGAAAQIAFLDPPYAQGLIEKALDTLASSGWIDGKTLLVLETHKREDIDPEKVMLVDTRRYGTSQIAFGFLKD